MPISLLVLLQNERFWLRGYRLTEFRQLPHLLMKVLHHVCGSLENHPRGQLRYHRGTWPVFGWWRGWEYRKWLQRENSKGRNNLRPQRIGAYFSIYFSCLFTDLCFFLFFFFVFLRLTCICVPKHVDERYQLSDQTHCFRYGSKRGTSLHEKGWFNKVTKMRSLLILLPDNRLLAQPELLELVLISGLVESLSSQAVRWQG